MKTRRQTNSLPPPRFKVEEISEEEGLDSNVDIPVDDAVRESAHKFLLRHEFGNKG
jgi:hypothetical protein